MDNNELMAKLMLGKDEIQYVDVEVNGEMLNIPIRPLTDGELNKLKIIEQRKINFQTEVSSDGKSTPVNTAKINTGEFLEGQHEAKYSAIAWSMSCDGITVSIEQVKCFPKGVPDKLFEKVIEISSLTKKDLTVVQSFQ